MKIATSLFAGLLLIGTMGSIKAANAADNTATAADGVIEKEPLNTSPAAPYWGAAQPLDLNIPRCR